MSGVKRGIFWPLEEEANRMIRESLQGVTKHSEKSDILTPWKEADRHKKEVYVPSGVPDSSLRRGIFHRSLNPSMPHLNSAVGSVNRTGSLSAFIASEET